MSVDPRIVHFLSRVPLFKGMDERMINVLAGVMPLKREEEGTVLCEQGGPGDACFVVGHGQVEIRLKTPSESKLLAILGAGHVVGEVALIDGKKRSATVVCKSNCSIFSLQRLDFEQLFQSGNIATMRLLDNIARDLAKRVRTVNQRYADLFSNAGATMAELKNAMEELRGETESAGEDVVGSATDELMKLVGYQNSPSSR